MIKNKAKFFKTMFIRYNSKQNHMQDSEVSDLIKNLKMCGSKVTAKTKTINEKVHYAFHTFKQLREVVRSQANFEKDVTSALQDNAELNDAGSFSVNIMSTNNVESKSDVSVVEEIEY